MIDVILVSDAKTDRLRKITQQAIDTAKADEGVRCIVVESFKDKGHLGAYQDALTVWYPQINFNYNKALNEGARVAAIKNPGSYIAFCNNDIVFTPGWTDIVREMQENGFESASPWCEYAHPPIHGQRRSARIFRGRKTRVNLAGWCFIWSRKLYDNIGPLPTDYTFFCADNATEKLMERNKIAHYLSGNYVVNHLGSMTLKTLDKKEREVLTVDEVKKWNRNNNKNLFGWGV